MLSSKQQEKRDEKILLVVKTFIDNNCRITDKELSLKLNIPTSTVGRCLNSTRTKELIGIDNFAYIKRERLKNKSLGQIKGGSKKKND